MKIIFATEPIKYPLTGIGRYSLELVKRLAVAREIEELKLFHGASFIDQIPQVENKSDTKASNHGRLSAFLRRQPLLIEAYRLLHPRRRRGHCATIKIISTMVPIFTCRIAWNAP